MQFKIMNNFDDETIDDIKSLFEFAIKLKVTLCV